MSRGGKSGGGSFRDNLGSAYYSLDDFQASDTAIAEGYTEQFAKPKNSILDKGKFFVTNFLDPLTHHLGDRVPIESWYRVPRLNSKLGGSGTSFHLTGEAIDTVKRPAEFQRKLIKLIISARLPFTELILYGSKTAPDHLHIALVKGRGSEREVLYKTPQGDYEELNIEWLKKNFV